MSLLGTRRDLQRCGGSSVWKVLIALLCALAATPLTRAARTDLCAADGLRVSTSNRTEYRVGVLAIRGFPAAYREFNRTFDEYLTATAGKKFTTPIRFRLVPLNFNLLFTEADAQRVDFIFVNPSAFSCIESEYGANSLTSMTNKRNVGGQSYLLSRFGGVILVKADRTDITRVKDIRGKRIAAASISGLGSGQMQFRRMQQAGMSYINDPSQVLFTSNQGKVVNGVLNGQFDVGFVRTDQIERTKDSTGTLIDPTRLKIIEPLSGLEDVPGQSFPFESSTILYPEWNVGALSHVPDDVAAEVQHALMQLEHKAEAAQVVVGRNNTLMEIMRTTGEAAPNVNELALWARLSGSFQGWGPTLSYMELRNMQEETGFIQMDPADGKMKCTRSSALIEGIVCPKGHFRRSEEDINAGCDKAGLACYGYQCVCTPCIKGFEEDILPTGEGQNATDLSTGQGCPKMSVCGITQQRKPIQFRISDNQKRGFVNFSYTLHLEGDQRMAGVATQNVTAGTVYTFSVETSVLGTHLLQIEGDGIEVSESPIRLTIENRDCEAEFGEGSFRTADKAGDCICAPGTVQTGASCVRLAVLLPAILVPIFLIALVLVLVWLHFQRGKADSVWAVRPEELNFAEPVEILGRGTFGLVLRAEYRGTVVAVKRVIPPKTAPQTRGVQAALGFFRGKSDSLPNSKHFKMLDDQNLAGIGGSEASFTLENSLDDLDMLETGGGNGKRDLFTMSQIMARGTTVSDRIAPTPSAASAGATSVSSDVGSLSGLFHSQAFKSGSNNKSASKPASHAQLRKEFVQEMRTLSKLRHPCITTVMGAVIENGAEPMLIMEFMEHGSLYDMLHNDTIQVEGELVLPILRDIAQGLRFLHAATPVVVHGDLKAQNVLVDSKFRAKVADFGLTQKRAVGATGTPFWMAPELFQGATNSPSSDVYAFGIVLYEVYSRSEPYEGEDPEQVLRLVVDDKVQKRPGVPPTCPPEVTTLMNDCLVADPARRPTFEEIDQRMKTLTVTRASPLDFKFSLQAKKDLRAQQAEDVLNDVFPPHIAAALREGKKVEPESRDCVTIFFSDIKGFTTISSQMPPHKVSNMLDRLYSKFDTLSHEHEVFKVETIGDAYMAVTNLVQEQGDSHAARIAHFAQEAVTAARETLIDEDDPSKGSVSIRVGFHSGPVVANVVGTRAPRYCLFGDTVNTASRMESNSQENRILCSSRAAHLVHAQAPDIKIVCRGVINVKGKGDMKVYWVGTNPAARQTLDTLEEEPEATPSTPKLKHTDSGNTATRTGSAANSLPNTGSFNLKGNKNHEQMPPLPTPPSNGAPPVLAMGASPAPPAPAAPAPAALPADFDMQDDDLEAAGPPPLLP